MSDHHHELEQSEQEDETVDTNTHATNTPAPESAAANRRERRKLTKKEKRKKKRKEVAEMARRIDEARLNDPEEVTRLEAEEEAENARIESERKEFEERERRIVEDWERRRAIEEEESERRRIALEEEERLKENQVGQENELDEDGWEYVEDGPPEIIWQGNEIIVKKKKVRVKKKETDQQIVKEDPNRPTSNPLPPQSEAFADYKNGSLPSAQQLLENVAQQTPNFGTEQDKAHCPFHLKTGACRFGSRCSRIHFYPDKSCTFLIKNMYNGPGLAWEQDEGLEHTDEEVEHAYEEFYEDVHTEFLKFGEIVNFKVCRNGASHLRGNVYVHFKSLDSAVLAYQSVNGRYFAGKLVQCEFVGVTKWKVAICGEYMKSKLKTCSRGMTCNFIHCFRNPGGDYEWADWDKPPPRYWVEKMVALFGFSDESGNGKQTERRSPGSLRNSSRIPTNYADRYCSRRSQSRDIDFSRGSRNYRNNDVHSSSHRRHPRNTDRKESEIVDSEDQRDDKSSRAKRNGKNASSDSDSDRNRLERDRSRSSRRCDSSRKRSRAHSNENLESQGSQSERTRMRKSDANANSDSDREKYDHDTLSRRKTTEQEKIVGEGHEGRSRWDWSDEDNRHKAGSQSGTSTRARRRSEVFTSPDDFLEGRSRTDDNNLTGDWSDGEKGVSSPIYAERRPRSHAREESEDEKSKHKLNRSSSEEYTVRGSEEVDCARGKHHSGRRYKSPGCGSRKDVDRLKDGDSKNESHGSNRTSKRKRDSESRVQYHEGKRSRVSNYESDEDTEERGRWEPE